MLIANTGQSLVVMNLRTGEQVQLPPAQRTSLDDSKIQYIDDSAVLIALFNAGVLVAYTDAGAAYPGFPTTANPADSKRIPPVDADYAAAVVGAAALSQESMPTDLPWLAARSPGSYTQVSLPSPYSPGHVLHPSITYFPNGWRGYNYWCAYTPYPNADSAFENPCVAASKDGHTWVPIGPQPVFPRPSLSTFNSDTDITYDAANNALVMIYRVSGDGIHRLFITTSTDGASWSSPVLIWTGNSAAFRDIASPSIWYNNTTAKWEIVGHNIADGAAWALVKITSSSLLSGWDTTLTSLTFVAPAGRKWWHSQFRRLSSGAIVGIAQDNSGTVGVPGNLYCAYSADGLTFSYSALDVSGGWYRPSFVIRKDVFSGDYGVDFFGSKLNTATLFRARMLFDKGVEVYGVPSQRASILAAATIQQRNLLIADTFTRADDATTLGSATNGVAYTAVAGPTNVLGISGNKCYNVTTGNCRSVINVAVSDHISSIRLDTKAGGAFLIVRYIDANNYLRVGINGSTSQLTFQRIAAANVDLDQQLGITPANGDEVTVRCVGAQHSIWLNDALIATVIEDRGLTATSVGLQMSGTLGGRLDNYIVVKI